MPGRYIVVYDCFPGKCMDLPREVGWQFSPVAKVSTELANQVLCCHPQGRIHLHTSAGLRSPRTFVSHEDRLRGWISERYGSMNAAPYVVFEVLPVSLVVATALVLGDHERITPVSAEPAEAHGLLISVWGPTFADRFLVSGDDGLFRAQKNLPIFEGALLQLLQHDGRPESSSGLEVRTLSWPQHNREVEGSSGAINMICERKGGALRPTYSQVLDCIMSR